ncbi:thiopeptide-type bacteriocin biosynthesis protein [uncultured Gimesia sp.]|uniref:thiopeptide-type bacteriocin biosynthesis protein n=1 Tax=uncultured Gimesia sp. TaxID=1678688 RepID=UPI0030D6DCA6|tara:strand:+ start:8942 stop:9730 length:789 start_codon:yes stop_codon:yes gene_type:complete
MTTQSFTEWNSRHFYITPKHQIEWLAYTLADKVAGYSKDAKWFFVRYADRFDSSDRFREDDSDCHIRFRYESNLSLDLSCTLWIDAPYVPEVKRYGGNEWISTAEAYFVESSRFVIDQIVLCREASTIDYDKWRGRKYLAATALTLPVLSLAAKVGNLQPTIAAISSFHSHSFRVVGETHNLRLKSTIQATVKSAKAELSSTQHGKRYSEFLESIPDEFAEYPQVTSSLLHMNMNRLGFLPLEEFKYFQQLSSYVTKFNVKL